MTQTEDYGKRFEMNYLFFDNAATTRCCPEAGKKLLQYSCEEFGNPSSTHILGKRAAQAIQQARVFFASQFKTLPEHIVFTASGTEADNMALYGATLSPDFQNRKPRIVVSAVEHPAVLDTARSLAELGIDLQIAPVDENCQILEKELFDLITENTVLVSIMRLNNIVGSILPVEELARKVKAIRPEIIFHTDAVQAFGKVSLPTSESAIDLVSLSSHKIEGPKGVGALVILNSKILSHFRPLIRGGAQENGFRSGTQSTGLIAAFHAAAERMLLRQASYVTRVGELKSLFKKELETRNLLGKTLTWNSPTDASPNIVNLSSPGIPSSPIAKLLEEKGCLISVGSACASKKVQPDPVLTAMGLPQPVCSSALRISFSDSLTDQDIQHLAQALEESLDTLKQLMG